MPAKKFLQGLPVVALRIGRGTTVRRQVREKFFDPRIADLRQIAGRFRIQLVTRLVSRNFPEGNGGSIFTASIVTALRNCSSSCRRALSN